MPTTARTTRIRTRLLAAATVTLAALVLTACEDGEGGRDEGPSHALPGIRVVPVDHPGQGGQRTF